MSGFEAINQFGSLTTKGGQAIKFEDFDKEGDGKVTKEEYNSLLKEVELDTVNFDSVDENSDKSITEDEFKKWQQEIEIQNAVNLKLEEASENSISGAKLGEISKELKYFMSDFIKNYTGDVSNLSSDFQSALDTKYTQYSSDLVKNNPNTIKNNILDEMYNDLSTNVITRVDGTEGKYSPEEVQTLCQHLKQKLKSLLNNIKAIIWQLI